MSLKRPCLEPGCPHLVGRGESRCPEHKRKHQLAYDAYRGTADERGYDADHRKWRAAVLARDPICKACGKSRATFADHVIPLNQGGAKLDLANGQGMCGPCHQAKRGRERHQHSAPPRGGGPPKGPTGSGGGFSWA